MKLLKVLVRATHWEVHRGRPLTGPVTYGVPGPWMVRIRHRLETAGLRETQGWVFIFNPVPGNGATKYISLHNRLKREEYVYEQLSQKNTDPLNSGVRGSVTSHRKYTGYVNLGLQIIANTKRISMCFGKQMV